MEDIFDHPVSEPDLITAGRYNLPDPYTGKPRRWTRVSNFAKTISDSYTLSEWSQRMTAKGLSLRPDLLARVSHLDVKNDREELNRIVSSAKKAAGGNKASHTGTQIHAFAEEIDAGRMHLKDVPTQYRANVTAYRESMTQYGLRVLPALQECTVCLPQFDVAGRFDKIVQCQSGKYRIGDIKSGQTLTYSELEISVQLALYAHGLNETGVYDQGARAWSRDVPQVEMDYALVLHTPAGSGECTPYRVDIAAGWGAVRVCADARDWRKRRGLFAPYLPETS